ncbi:hypothetical protein BDN71DRAFT_1589015, partial [Pleurotus eryngii]
MPGAQDSSVRCKHPEISRSPGSLTCPRLVFRTCNDSPSRLQLRTSFSSKSLVNWHDDGNDLIDSPLSSERLAKGPKQFRILGSGRINDILCSYNGRPGDAFGEIDFRYPRAHRLCKVVPTSNWGKVPQGPRTTGSVNRATQLLVVPPTDRVVRPSLSPFTAM